MLHRNRNNKAALSFRENVSCCFTSVGVVVVSAFFLWLFFDSAAKMMPDFFQILLSLMGEASGGKNPPKSGEGL